MKLTDSLMSGVKFAEAKDARLAWVDGHIKMRNFDNLGVENVPVLDVLAPSEVRHHFRFLNFFKPHYMFP